MDIVKETHKCAVCGKESEQIVPMGVTNFGVVDLDTRSEQSKQNGMSTWYEKCPRCGYVNSYIDKVPEGLKKAWLKEEDYVQGGDLSDEVAQDFYRIYLLLSKVNDFKWGAHYIKNAAWACDDANKKKDAVKCRKLYVETVDKYLEGIINKKERENLQVIRCDMLRRMGKFEQVLEEYGNLEFSQDILNHILAYELHLSKKEDKECHNMDEMKAFEKKSKKK